jgi:hypothetical protein
MLLAILAVLFHFVVSGAVLAAGGFLPMPMEANAGPTGGLTVSADHPTNNCFY